MEPIIPSPQLTEEKIIFKEKPVKFKDKFFYVLTGIIIGFLLSYLLFSAIFNNVIDSNETIPKPEISLSDSNIKPSPYVETPLPINHPRSSPDPRSLLIAELKKVPLEAIAASVSGQIEIFNNLSEKNSNYNKEYDNLFKLLTKVVEDLNSKQSKYLFELNSEKFGASWRKGENTPFKSIVSTRYIHLYPINDSNDSSRESDLQKIDQIIDSSFASTGFELNPFNTSPSLEFAFFRTYKRGYSRNKQFCLYQRVSLHYPNYYGITLDCAENEDQASFDDTLYEPLKTEPTQVITSATRIGNIARIGIADVRFFSGWYSLVSIQGNKVEKLYSGQEDPTCELVETWKISSKLVKKCWEGDIWKENIY